MLVSNVSWCMHLSSFFFEVNLSVTSRKWLSSLCLNSLCTMCSLHSTFVRYLFFFSFVMLLARFLETRIRTQIAIMLSSSIPSKNHIHFWIGKKHHFHFDWNESWTVFGLAFSLFTRVKYDSQFYWIIMKFVRKYFTSRKYFFHLV